MSITINFLISWFQFVAFLGLNSKETNKFKSSIYLNVIPFSLFSKPWIADNMDSIFISVAVTGLVSTPSKIWHFATIFWNEMAFPINIIYTDPKICIGERVNEEMIFVVWMWGSKSSTISTTCIFGTIVGSFEARTQISFVKQVEVFIVFIIGR